MAFTIEMASFLTGATNYQLRSWKTKGIVVPEVRSERPMLYSFRDLVALRTITRLRSRNPLQRIRRALDTLSDQELQEHISEYRFATDGRSIKVWTEAGFLDLVNNPGQWEFVSLEDIYAPFENMNGREVPHFLQPSDGIELRADRLGGWPLIEGTRVPFDCITDLLSDEDMSIEEIQEYYPNVSASAVEQAQVFDQKVRLVAA